VLIRKFLKGAAHSLAADAGGGMWAWGSGLGGALAQVCRDPSCAVWIPQVIPAVYPRWRRAEHPGPSAGMGRAASLWRIRTCWSLGRCGGLLRRSRGIYKDPSLCVDSSSRSLLLIPEVNPSIQVVRGAAAECARSIRHRGRAAGKNSGALLLLLLLLLLLAVLLAC